MKYIYIYVVDIGLCVKLRLFHRKLHIKERIECLVSSAAHYVDVLGAVATHGPTWASSARRVRLMCIHTLNSPLTGIESLLHFNFMYYVVQCYCICTGQTMMMI